MYSLKNYLDNNNLYYLDIYFLTIQWYWASIIEMSFFHFQNEKN